MNQLGTTTNCCPVEGWSKMKVPRLKRNDIVSKQMQINLKDVIKLRDKVVSKSR